MNKLKIFIKRLSVIEWISIGLVIFIGIKLLSMFMQISPAIKEIQSSNNSYVQDLNKLKSTQETQNKDLIKGFLDFQIVKNDNGGIGMGGGYLTLVIILSITCVIRKRYKKYQKEVKSGNIPSDYLAKFNELYDELCKKDFSKLEKMKKKKRYQRLILIAVIILSIILCIVNIYFIPFIFFGIILIIVLIKAWRRIFKEDDDYIREFKSKVVDPIIKLALPGAIYTPKDGISRAKYNEVDWDYYDIFESEDLIEGKITLNENPELNVDITMSEVLTKTESRDSDGKTYTHESFSGLVAYTKLPKDLECEIHVIRGKGGNNKLSLDMPEFEKLYDVETNDEIKATEVLTSDIMADIVDLTKESQVDFRFDIQKDKLYFKFYTGKMFEPKIFSKSLEKTMLKKYYNIVRMCVKISKDICETLLKTNI